MLLDKCLEKNGIICEVVYENKNSCKMRDRTELIIELLSYDYIELVESHFN